MPLLVLVLAFSTFATNGVSANTGNENLELATLKGDFDLSSSKAVKVIVELQEESIVEAKHNGKKQSKQNLKSARDKVKKEVAERTSKSKVGREYDYVFSGFSLEIPANEIPSLLATPGVKAVYPNVKYTTTEVVTEEEFSPSMVESAPFIGSNEAWKLGFTGEGVKVAVIDTGVDYTHPDLAPNFKEYLGWDFVDNDADPQETPKGDPRGAETTHGTHVAGTVAANGENIRGVAPDATLLAYRVLGPGGSGSTENVVAAIERAVKDGADVMNLSLGNSLNAPDWATSIALDHAMAEGVVAVTSNGNAGPNNWTVGSPGTSREAISVGATQLPYNVFTAVTTSSDGVSYASSAVQGFPTEEELLGLNGQDFELVDVGFGAPANFAGKDLTGKIALISRGAGIPFVDKATEAAKAGAVGAVLYNNVDGVMPLIPGMAVPTIMLNKADGEALKAKASNVTVSFNIAFDKRVGETMAGFSSRGPVVDTWMIKPDVSAPGVNIVSTVPTFDPANPHGYGAKQGTSMASPHVAGAAAVILQANPEWGVYEVKSALMNTAEKLIDPTTGKEYAHNSQGAGSIRVVDALQAETLVNPGSYSFGVFEQLEEVQEVNQHFEIKNLSNKVKNYSVEFNFKNEVGKHVKVKSSKNTRVNPGKIQKVNLVVEIDASKLAPGYYEGNLLVKDGSEKIHVPTILFVGEPDYPRVTHFGFTPMGDNNFEFYSYLPGGAEELEVWVFTATSTGGLGAYVGEALYEANLGKGYNYHDWDGTLVDGTELDAGSYRIAVYAKKGNLDRAILAADVLTIQ
ncbi:S8 family serine peptidase [Bacillus sp. RO1]|uniref:S8 family serine peptidase n=1 Tax=Bacillus sp. RO1 TaxID=2722703 RepID=UPI00145789C5|nr:S8 family serine peptidase [Bacillus sp. RO1]NLP51247.1 S8 family serine peptidase [Bacillus sp. RO1]